MSGSNTCSRYSLDIMKSIIPMCWVLFFLLVPISASFLLDMNQEMNPINDDFDLPGMGYAVYKSKRPPKIAQHEQNSFSKSLAKMEEWIGGDLLKKQNKILTAKIAKIFNLSFEQGQLPDSIIKRLSARRKKSFKKINIIKTVDADINTAG